MQLSTENSFFLGLFDFIDRIFGAQFNFGAQSIALAAVVLLVSVWAVMFLIARRRKRVDGERHLEALLASLRIDHDRMKTFLSTETQIFISWTSSDGEPDIQGDLAALTEAVGAKAPLSFNLWLSPKLAQSLDAAVHRLRLRGEGFHLMLQATNGRHIEAEGRAVIGSAVLRLRDVSSTRQELLQIASSNEAYKTEILGLRGMLDTLAQPIWLRDKDGHLNWVNEAYAFAVEATDASDVIARQIEFLDYGNRNEAAETTKSGEVFQRRFPAVVLGQRRIFDVVETPVDIGALGYAADVTDLETVRSDLVRHMANHVGTLDQLPTAVAIFDERQKLTFCNLAYRKLWQLTDAFVDSHPTDSEVLDCLRDARRLPEQADYRSWKRALLEAYRSVETQETAWYLPGGRTLRVVINPNPQGGITYLFDDVTAQFHLESSFNSLTQVQSETLNSLKEGVAVFGTDGRLKLRNQSFESIWKLDGTRIANRPHIDQIILDAHHLFADVTVWTAIRSGIVGLNESRKGQFFRMERHDGSIVDCALAPLPDGATLVTFVDVSDTVQVERALKEKNDALEQAAQLRENFIHHVSYQLRSPLTNVIGFTELLASGTAGALNERQGEYASHVIHSSNALMAIIDDILDLASFDSGEAKLDISDTNVLGTIEIAVEGLKDRLAEQNINLVVDSPSDIGSFRADTKRIRQVLFNLLSNAIGFSSVGQTVTVTARRYSGGLSLSVRDEGRGIPRELIDRVFDRFETHSAGTRHRGVGLGLSIVRALVELHGGQVKIVSEPGAGTLVSCLFPDDSGKPIRAEVAA
jgi:signal transduction histidine kinase